MYINKNIYLEMPVVDKQFNDIDLNNSTVMVAVQTNGNYIMSNYECENEDDELDEMWGFELSDFDDEELGYYDENIVNDDNIDACCKLEFVSLKNNLIYDYTKQQIYLLYAEYDYIIPYTRKEKHMMLHDVLSDSGFFGARYNQRQNKLVIWERGKGFLINELECVVFTDGNVERCKITNLEKLIPDACTFDALCLKYLRCSMCTLNDYVIDKTRTGVYFKCWRYLSPKHKHLLNMVGVRWENDECLDRHFNTIDFNRFLDYTEVYEILKHGENSQHMIYPVNNVNSNKIADKLKYITEKLQIDGVPRDIRVNDFRRSMFGYILDTYNEQCKYFKENPKHWYRKVRNEDGVYIVLRREWYNLNEV